MQKIKDRFTAGVIAGLAANLVKGAIEWTAYGLGISRQTGADKAAGFFLPPKQVKSRIGRTVGFLGDFGIAAGLGVIDIYLMTFSGKDHAIFKGLCIGSLTWNSAYGVLSRMGASSIKNTDPKSTLTSFVAHTAYGATQGFLAAKITDPALFGKPNLATPQIDNTQATQPTMSELNRSF